MEAVIYGLIESFKLVFIDRQSYLQYVLGRIAGHMISRVGKLLPWNIADKFGQPRKLSDALTTGRAVSCSNLCLVSTAPLRHQHSFVEETRGQITVGEVRPVRWTALAARRKKARVVSVSRDRDTISQLLERFDSELAKTMAGHTVVYEVLPGIKRRGSR